MVWKVGLELVGVYFAGLISHNPYDGMATTSTGHRRRVTLSPVRIFILRSYPRCNRLRTAHCQTFWEFRFFQHNTHTTSIFNIWIALY